MYSYEYPRPALTVDIAIICYDSGTPKILLIKRANSPFKNHWALPGGFVDIDENLETAANRELEEETGLENILIKQFHTFGDLNRDPRGRTVSVVYYGIIEEKIPSVEGGDDASEAEWFQINNLPPLAFDHQKILNLLIAHLKF